VAGDAWQRLAIERIPIAAWSGYALPNCGRAVRRLLIAAAVIALIEPSFSQTLGNADLSDSEIKGNHQSLVLFEAYCGYRDKPTTKCAVAITPSRLYVNNNSISLKSILDVFSGSGHDKLIGNRFREYSSGLKKSRSELTGIYYKRNDGSVGLAAFAFGSQQCGFNFNRTLQFIRLGGSIPLSEVANDAPCGLTADTSFDLKSNYK
jgi:hypothetical protein